MEPKDAGNAPLATFGAPAPAPALVTGPLVATVAQLLVVCAVAGVLAGGGVALSPAAWFVGIACATATNALLAQGFSRYGVDRRGPAAGGPAARAALAVGVAALVAQSFDRPVATPLLASLTVVALALDAVDGWVARRTQTTAPLGARLDGEVDAFLIAVLSV